MKFDPHAACPPGVTYAGDVNPIPHGGLWIKLIDWRAPHGYAETVCIEEEDGLPDLGFYAMGVSVGMVDRKDDGAFACSGLDTVTFTSDAERDAAEALAIVHYRGSGANEAEWFLLRDDDEPFAMDDAPSVFLKRYRHLRLKPAVKAEVIAYVEKCLSQFAA